MEGYNNDEIADQLGCARRTVARRLELIRKTWLAASRWPDGRRSGRPKRACRSRTSSAHPSALRRIRSSLRATATSRGSKNSSSAPATRDREALLRELLLLEVELKRERGEATSPDDYRTRFPDAASDIVAAFAQAGPPPAFRGAGSNRGRAVGPRNSQTHGRSFLPPRSGDSSGSLSTPDGSFGWIGEYEVL